MQNKKIKIFIIAGEVSGDVLGAGIIREMSDIAEFSGVGGEHMTAMGLKSIFPMSDLAVMGVIEVVAHARTLTRRIRECANAIIQTAPDIVLTIDAPGFARSVIDRVRKSHAGQQLIERGMRFHHVVAPQVWAWRPTRARKYARTFDKLYAFFDFEVPYFTKYGLDTIAVGHPLATDIIGKFHPTTNDGKLITLVPGSRMSEVTRLMPILQDIVSIMATCGYNGYKFAIPTVETTDAYVRNHIRDWAITPQIVPAAQRYSLYEKTYIAIVASGTVSAELAMMHIPAIVMYKMNRITTWLVARVINVKWVSLVNILLNKTVYPEFLGPNARAEQILIKFGEIIIPSVRQKMIDTLATADSLWQPHKSGAIATIAHDITQTVSKHKK